MIQPEKLGVRHPMCMLVLSKAGVALYRITSEGKKLILKIKKIRVRLKII